MDVQSLYELHSNFFDIISFHYYVDNNFFCIVYIIRFYMGEVNFVALKSNFHFNSIWFSIILGLVICKIPILCSGTEKLGRGHKFFKK